MAVVGESGSGKTTLLQLLSAQLDAGAGRVLYRMRDGVTRDLAALERGGAAVPVPHRLGLRAPGRRAGPAHGGVRRRQCRRAADGGRLAPLRPHPPQRRDLARSRRDRRLAHRRHAAHLFGRHAAAAADRPQSGDPAAARLHGRADRRARRFGAGAAARSAARAGRRSGAGRGGGDSRSRGRAAAFAPDHGDEGRRGDRDRPDRSGARRSAREPTPSFSCPRSCRHEATDVRCARAFGSRQDLHHAPAGRRPAAGRVGRRVHRPAGRMRGARRPLGHRQVVDPEDDLRQLPLRRGTHPGAPGRHA